MPKSRDDLYDSDSRNDPFRAEYEAARDLLETNDWRQGLEGLERLAESGSIMSILLVADRMRTGRGYDQDFRRAETWYRVAAESGAVRGLFGLGVTHLLMDRFDEAFRELDEATVRNYPPAMNALAGMYFRGNGIPVDRKKALELYRKGASLGHLPSRRNLVKQSLRGCFGPFWYLVGLLNLLPTAVALAMGQSKYRDSDRLR